MSEDMTNDSNERSELRERLRESAKQEWDSWTSESRRVFARLDEALIEKAKFIHNA